MPRVGRGVDVTRLPSIDGLRAIAALLVIVFHSFHPYWEANVLWLVSPGLIGVRLFFVLSGALISGLLWQMQDEGRGFAATWGRFAYRRALRIFPLAYFAMAVCWLVGVPAMLDRPWFFVTFTNNLAEPLDPNWPDGLPHFWTLAVEEQIYLLWPVLALLIPLHRWPWAAVALMAVGVVSRIYWPWPVWYAPNLYVDSFAAGSLIAWSSSRREVLPFASGLFAVLGVSVVAVSWPDIHHAAGLAWLETGLVLLTAAVVGFAWSRPRLPVLSWRPLVWLGTLSYGIYVWHEAAPRMLCALGFPYDRDGFDVLALKAGLGIGCAALTWYGFEKPINRLKDKLSQNNSQNETASPNFASIPARFPPV